MMLAKIKNLSLNQLCALSALLLLALALIQTGYLWLPSRAIKTSETTMTSPNIWKQINQIPQQHLFGKSLAGQNIIETTLPLTLTGVMYSKNHTVAIISWDSNQKSHAYQPGDALPFGARLVKITPDHILLNANGMLRRLTLHLPTL